MPASNHVIMEMLSERYGWTPSQIREMSIEDVVKYMQIIQAHKAAEKRNAQRQKYGQ